MNSFQWMIRRYTTADTPLTHAELKRLEHRCNELVGSQQRRFWLILIFACITAGLAALVGSRVLAPSIAVFTGLDSDICRALAAFLCVGITTACWFVVFTRMYIRPLRRALTELGYTVCEYCGYSLRGLADESITCPECGRRQPTTPPPAP